MVLRQNIINIGGPIPGYDIGRQPQWTENASTEETDILVRDR